MTNITDTTTRPLAPKREIFGWAMYDFANQAYTLLIITVIFGDLFTRVVVGDAPDYRMGNLLWSISLATSYLLVVACAPVAGAIMDYSASKKRFLFAGYLLTVITTAMLYFVAPGYAALGVLLLILSNFAFSIGESFISSFLPELGPPRSLGKISGFGWGLGYIGGLVCAAFALGLLGEVSLENFERIRWVGPLAAAFVLVACIPTFIWLRERGIAKAKLPAKAYLRVGIQRVGETLTHLRAHRQRQQQFEHCDVKSEGGDSENPVALFHAGFARHAAQEIHHRVLWHAHALGSSGRARGVDEIGGCGLP